MLTTGSVSRAEATVRFPFLAPNYPGRRKAIKEFTHRDPDFVFRIYPDGRLLDARTSHLRHPPPGYAHILDDEPDYGGFLRGRLATSPDGHALLVVYCRPAALSIPGSSLTQFVAGIDQLQVTLPHSTLTVSDNGDIYGTVQDLQRRAG